MSRRQRWAGLTAVIRIKRNLYKILISGPEYKRLFWKHGHIWGYNIKMSVNEISL